MSLKDQCSTIRIMMHKEEKRESDEGGDDMDRYRRSRAVTQCLTFFQRHEHQQTKLAARAGIRFKCKGYVDHWLLLL